MPELYNLSRRGHNGRSRYNSGEVEIKKIFKIAASWLLATGLFASLFLLAYFMVFNQITANPGRVKQIVRDSGIYQKIPSVIYDDAVNSESTSSASIPLKSPEVRQIALDTFNPGFAQTNIENAIDGVYGWLGGQTGQPEFTIDLQGAKDRFATSLGNRLDKLPVCAAGQKVNAENFEPFSSPCIPEGVDRTAIKKQVVEAASKSNELVSNPKITPATIKDANGKPVFDNYAQIPKAYQVSVKLPYVMAVICLVFAGGLILASRTRREGFKKLGKLLIMSGIFVILLPIGLSQIINGIVQAAPDDKVSKELVVPLVHEINKATSRVYVTTGLAYILIAGLIFIILREMPAKLPSIRKNS